MKNEQIAKNIPVIIAGLLALPLVPGTPAILLFTVFALLCPFRHEIHRRFLKTRFWLEEKYMVTAMAFCMLAGLLVMARMDLFPADQAFSFSFNPAVNIVMAFGFYFALSYAWHFILRRYSIGVMGVFALSGITGLLIESEGAVLASIFNGPAGIYIWLVTFVTYGAVFTLPYLLLEEEFDKLKRQSTIRAYPLALLAQAAAVIGSVFWIMIIRFLSGG